jgi:hypothetical protein
MKPRNVINLSLNFLIPPRKASAKLKQGYNMASEFLELRIARVGETRKEAATYAAWK